VLIRELKTFQMWGEPWRSQVLREPWPVEAGHFIGRRAAADERDSPNIAV